MAEEDREERDAQAVVCLPAWETLPDIGLYMDQVITLMERTFLTALPKGEITKSMVNNYVKVGLVPRPVGKKYDREHLAMLLMVAVLKQALSMENIARMLAMLCRPGVCEGYTRFALEVQGFEEAMGRGRIELGAGSDSAQEQALHAGIAAAMCTIRARRLLGLADEAARRS